jgi:hypothetical protein
MIKVKVYNRNPSEVMEIVRDLRANGLVQGKDFDFAYHQNEYSDGGWELIEPEHTVFMFHTEKYATLFAIKYST